MSKALNELGTWFSDVFQIIGARPLNVIIVGACAFGVEVALGVVDLIGGAIAETVATDGATVVSALMKFVGFLVRPLVTAAVLGCALAWARGRDATLADAALEGGSLLKTYLAVLLATLLPGLVAVFILAPFAGGGAAMVYSGGEEMLPVLVGLLILGGLIAFPVLLAVGALVLFAPALSADRSLGPIAALRESASMARTDILGLMLFILLMGVFFTVFTCIACLTLCLGFVFYYPLYVLFPTLAYRSYFGLGPDPRPAELPPYMTPHPPQHGM